MFTFRRSKGDFCKERFNRLIIPGLFNLCMANPIATYFENLRNKWPVKANTYLLKKGFIETYRSNFYSFLISRQLISITAVRQVWFMFYLYGYSMVVLFLLYRYQYLYHAFPSTAGSAIG